MNENIYLTPPGWLAVIIGIIIGNLIGMYLWPR